MYYWALNNYNTIIKPAHISMAGKEFSFHLLSVIDTTIKPPIFLPNEYPDIGISSAHVSVFIHLLENQSKCLSIETTPSLLTDFRTTIKRIYSSTIGAWEGVMLLRVIGKVFVPGEIGIDDVAMAISLSFWLFKEPI